MLPSSPATPGSFPRFPLLPTELRCRVWSLALPKSRIISLFPADTFDGYRVTSPQPVLFYINHESRSVAMRHFKLYVMSMAPVSSVDGQAEFWMPPVPTRAVWLDLSQDILFFTTEIQSVPRFRIRRVDIASYLSGEAPLRELQSGIQTEPFGGGESLEGKEEKDLALSEIVRLSIPYDTLILQRFGWCGTGLPLVWRALSKRIKALRAAVDALPYLRAVYVVVNHNKERDDDEEEDRPNIRRDLEFVDLKTSGNFVTAETDEIAKCARRAFGFPVDSGPDPETESRWSAMLPVVEVRRMASLDFTCTEEDAYASASASTVQTQP